MAICCNRRSVWTVHLIRHFCPCSEHALMCCTSHCMAQECVGALRLICIVIHVCDLIVCCLSLFLTLFPSVCFSYLFFFYLNLDLYPFLFHVDFIGAISHWHSAKWGVWPFRRKRSSHRLRAQAPWRFPLLRDYWNFLPGAIQRRGALVLAWRGDQWRHHRQSALFTTVHAGARRTRTSGLKTSLPLFWRKFVAKSVLVCLSCKNGETRAWT